MSVVVISPSKPCTVKGTDIFVAVSTQTHLGKGSSALTTFVSHVDYSGVDCKLAVAGKI